MNGLQNLADGLFDAILRELRLLAVVSLAATNLVLLEVFLTNFKSDRDASLLPVTVLVTRVLVISIVKFHSETSSLESFEDLFGLSLDALVVTSSLLNRDDDNLSASNSWWEHKTDVIRVHHDHRPYTSSGDTPRCLPDHFLLLVFVKESHIEHLCEVLSELMRGCSLDSSSTDWDVDLSGGGEVGSSKSLIV